MSAEEIAVALTGPQGVLRGIRHLPTGRDAGWSAVVLGGYFSCTHVGPARLYVEIGRRCARLGIETWRVDCAGVGDSDGDFGETTYESELADYRVVLRQAAAAGRRLLLIGHCLGASLALRLAVAEPQVGPLLLISPACGPFSFPGNVLSAAQHEELRSTGRTERKGTRIRRDFVAAIEDSEIYRIAGGVSDPVVVFHGEEDEYFDDGSMGRLLGSLPAGRLVSLAGADHNALLPGARAQLLAALERELAALTGA